MSNGRIKRSRSAVRSRKNTSRRWRSSSSRGEEGQVKKKHQKNKETRRSKEGARRRENQRGRRSKM